MKKILQSLGVCALVLALFSCATGGGAPDPVSGTMSLDEALAAAVSAVEAKVPAGTEIAVYEITSQNDEVGDFFLDELDNAFSAGGKLVLLARKDALSAVDTEHQFQMSGLVDDKSAVGIGHYLGAKVVITGTFDRYANHSRLRIRAVDVSSSAVAAMYTARIANTDPVLADIAAPFGDAALPDVTEAGLALLDSGKDLYAEGKYDEAIAKFNAALAADRNLADAYYYRGNAYLGKGDYDRAIAEYNEVLRVDPNDANAYNNRGVAYYDKGDYDRAIADYNDTLRINPNDASVYYNRGIAYYHKGDYDRAIADYNEALRINPNHANAYNNRGNAYYHKGEYDRAIADYNEALRINPNDAEAYYNRGVAYGNKGDLDHAIADYSEALRINPNFDSAYNNRGAAYYNKGDYDRAIADYNEALRINPNNATAKQNLDEARRQGAAR